MISFLLFCCSDVSKCKQWRVGLLPAIASSNTSNVYPGLENWWSFLYTLQKCSNPPLLSKTMSGHDLLLSRI